MKGWQVSRRCRRIWDRFGGCCDDGGTFGVGDGAEAEHFEGDCILRQTKGTATLETRLGLVGFMELFLQFDVLFVKIDQLLIESSHLGAHEVDFFFAFAVVYLHARALPYLSFW